MSTQVANELRLAARIVEVSALRRTPAGVPVATCVLAHESRRIEAGIEREVKLELEAMAIGALAEKLAGATPGASVEADGFLAAKSARSHKQVLHLNVIEFMEGN